MHSEDIQMLISLPFANLANAQQQQLQQPPESPLPSTPASGPSSLPPDNLQAATTSTIIFCKDVTTSSTNSSFENKYYIK